MYVLSAEQLPCYIEILVFYYLKFLLLLFFLVLPAIWVRQETVYASFGQKAVLECITESHPNSVNYWLRGRDFIQGDFLWILLKIYKM